jgi:hypothetical protein
MKTILILALICVTAFAGPLKKSDLEPNLDEPVVPGSRVPLEEMNTAPTPPEIAPEEKEFRDTLEARKQKEEALEKKAEPKIERKLK